MQQRAPLVILHKGPFATGARVVSGDLELLPVVILRESREHNYVNKKYTLRCLRDERDYLYCTFCWEIAARKLSGICHRKSRAFRQFMITGLSAQHDKRSAWKDITKTLGQKSWDELNKTDQNKILLLLRQS